MKLGSSQTLGFEGVLGSRMESEDQVTGSEDHVRFE